jgi:hypothetical protein
MKESVEAHGKVVSDNIMESVSSWWKEAFERKRVEFLPNINIDEDLSKGAKHIGTWKGARLKEIPHYRFSVKSAGCEQKQQSVRDEGFCFGKDKQ